MAFAIPRIQYKNVDTTGDTNSNTTVSNISDTSSLEVGMFVRGSGIPDGTTVAAIGANSVTLSQAATATASGVSLAFGYEILFDFPPVEPNGESYDTKAVISESLSGVRQVSQNHVEANRNLKFSFLSPSLYTQVDTFLTAHGLTGKSFRYYPDKTLSSYTEYELDSLKVAPKKIAPRGVDTYVWEVPLKFRRVL